MNDEFDAGAVVDALAPLLDFTLTPEERPAVVANLEIAARFAALVLEFPLGDHAEPAPVFTP